MSENTEPQVLEKLQESFFSEAWEKLFDYGMDTMKRMDDYKTNLEALGTNLKSLTAKASDVNEQIKNGELSDKRKRKREVDNWLKEVEEIESELAGLQNEVQDQDFLTRFFGNEDRVEKLNGRISKLVEESGHFGEFLFDTCATSGKSLLTTGVTGKAFEKNVEKIWKWLVIDKVPIIGIYGMGGVGKTTLAKRVNNQLLIETQCSVYWVAVSQVSTINKLQTEIAKAVGLDLSTIKDEDKRARKLNQALSHKKDFVLILDNVLGGINLEKLGDPLSVQGCRLIVTTRSLNVCHQIGCKEIIKVETLETDESWDLFREILGKMTPVTSEVEEIAKSVVKECDGLPLGIIVLARTMNGVTDIHEWRNVYDEICESPMNQDGMLNKVFRVLEYSFNRLDPEFHEIGIRSRKEYTKLQLCFLYCSLYPEDYEIEKDELIRKFISEELVDISKSREEQLDQGYTMLSKLVNLRLLECISTVHSECIKMCAFVRDMALKIARESPKYMGFGGLGLKKIPNEMEWTTDVEKMSLMYNNIVQIPEGMAPICPKLATLLLNGNPLVSIPQFFFIGMSGLCVLDLSSTSIRQLPHSLSSLTRLATLLLNECKYLLRVAKMEKLRTLGQQDLSNTSNLSKTKIILVRNSISALNSLHRLHLRECHRLETLPSMEKLLALRELDLSYTSIRKIPQGIKNLINLEILLFRGTKKLKLLPGDLSLKSQNLQHLELPLYIEAPVHEIKGLKQLKKFVGRFRDVSEFHQFTQFQSQTGRLISQFYYNVGSVYQYYHEAEPCINRNTVDMIECSLWRGEGEDGVIVLPENIHVLKIVKCEGLSSCVLHDFKSFPSFLEELRIVDCKGVHSILDINDHLMAETAINVGSFYLDRLLNFKGLVNWEVGDALPHSLPPQAATVFSSLASLYIGNCNKMKTLGLPLPCLQNIESIQIDSCDEIEELVQLIEVADDGDISKLTPSLPNLKHLNLFNLPKLKSICKARIDCKSIQEISIHICPILKKLPLFLPSSSSSSPSGQHIYYSPLPTLRKISIDEELWESLEWDYPTHKLLLQPFVVSEYVPPPPQSPPSAPGTPLTPATPPTPPSPPSPPSFPPCLPTFFN